MNQFEILITHPGNNSFVGFCGISDLIELYGSCVESIGILWFSYDLIWRPYLAYPYNLKPLIKISIIK